MRFLPTALVIAALTSTSALAREATLEGEWRDAYGTTLEISYCNGDETRLCAVLRDIQGESRTEANLEYVDEQILQVEMTADNRWRGTIIFEGTATEGTVTQVAPDVIEIEGCRLLILCEKLAFERVA